MKKDSHIKLGMHVRISELGDKKGEVLESFCKAIGEESCDPDFYSEELYLGITDYGGSFYVETYERSESFGPNNKLVTVDFILNGGDNKVIDDSEIKVGDTVKVVANGYSYTTYTEMSEILGLTEYNRDVRPITHKDYKVVGVGTHNAYSDRIILGIESSTGDQYLIGIDGVIKVDKDLEEKEELVELGRSLFGTKIRVTPETSKLVQEAVFAAGGYGWPLNDPHKVRFEDKPYIFITKDGAFSCCPFEGTFLSSGKKEVKVSTKTQLVVEDVVEDNSEALEELSKAQKELEEVSKRIEKIKSKLNTNQ